MNNKVIQSYIYLYLFFFKLFSHFSAGQSLSRVWLYATSCTAAHEAFLSITNSQSLLRLMSVALVMTSNRLTLCHPILFLPSIFPSIRVFSNEPILPTRWPKYWSFSFSISPSNKYSGNIFLSLIKLEVQFSSVSHVRLFANPWTAAHQASLSITNSQSLLKLMSIESVMPYYHLILCHPLFLLTSIFPSFKVFSNESPLHIRWPKYWSFSFSISLSNEYSGLISFRTDSLPSKGLSRVFSSTTVQKQ